MDDSGFRLELSKRFLLINNFLIVYMGYTTGKRWLLADEDYLREHYLNLTNRQLAAVLGTTSTSVEHKLQRLGLKRPYDASRRHIADAVRASEKVRIHMQELGKRVQADPLLVKKRIAAARDSPKTKAYHDRGRNPIRKTNAPPSDLAYVLGVLCGDGWTVKNTIGLSVVDAEFADKFAAKIESWSGLVPKRYTHVMRSRPHQNRVGKWIENRKQIHTVRLNTKTGFRWLQERFGSFKTDDWRIPDTILNGSNEEKRAFLQGLADSEGSVNVTARSVRVLIYSNNEPGLKQTMGLLESLGFDPDGLRIHKRPENTGGFCLHIRMFANAKRFYEKIGFSIARKQQKLAYGLSRPWASGKRKPRHKLGYSNPGK